MIHFPNVTLSPRFLGYPDKDLSHIPVTLVNSLGFYFMVNNYGLLSLIILIFHISYLCPLMEIFPSNVKWKILYEMCGSYNIYIGISILNDVNILIYYLLPKIMKHEKQL